MAAKDCSRFLPVLAILVVLAVSGCTFKGAGQGTGPDANQPVAAGGNDSNNPVQGGQASPDVPETGRALKALSPILCNDYLIVQSIEKHIGEGYSITRVPPAFGSFFQTANCIIKKDNVARVSYYIAEMADESAALKSLEDEKMQYEQQLFNAASQEVSGFGSRAYLFEQPVKEGSLYRVIFTDATNRKVVVFVKSITVLDPEFLTDIARAIEEVI